MHILCTQCDRKHTAASVSDTEHPPDALLGPREKAASGKHVTAWSEHPFQAHH